MYVGKMGWVVSCHWWDVGCTGWTRRNVVCRGVLFNDAHV